MNNLRRPTKPRQLTTYAHREINDSMGFRIAIGTRSDEFRDIDIYDDLDEAMDVLNELINRQNFKEPDSVVSLFNTSSGKKMAQYALQDFNYSQGR